MHAIKRLIDCAICGRFGQRRIDRYVLVSAYLLPLLGALDGRLFTVAALLYLPIIIYAAFFDWLYLIYPVFFFFYSQLSIGGIVIFRLYTLAFMARAVFGIALRLWRREPLKLNIPRIAFALFLLTVGLRYAIFGGFVKLGAILDLFFLLCFTMEARDGEDGECRFSRFTVAFVFGALTSCTVGISLAGDGGRYLATLGDPNYLGFYLNIAILIAFLHPFFKRIWVKIPVLVVLYTALVASESITGVICNGAVVLFCIAVSLITGRFKLKYLVLPLICGVVAVQTVYVSQVHEWGMISEVSARVIGKLDALFVGDISGFTTARSTLWRINLEKYVSFGGLKGLFGGAPVSAVGRDAALFPQTSHQELIDVLISTGALGLALYLASYVFVFAIDAVNLRKSRVQSKALHWMRIGIKLVWLFYAFGLTMFLGAGFFVPILI